MFDLCLCNAATIRYSQLKFGYMHLCGMDYKYFSPHCFKCNSFGCTATIRYGNACGGPHSDSLYSGSKHSQFNSPRLVKREVGFPNPRRALISSNQLWRVNDSPYYREYFKIFKMVAILSSRQTFWPEVIPAGRRIYQKDSHEHFRHFELLIDAVIQILTEIYQFQNLTYFVTRWRHQWRHEYVFI